MNKILSIFLVTLSLILLSACSPTGSNVRFVPPAAKPDQAIVYIYRPSTMTNALYSPGLNVDDEFKLNTKSGVSYRISLSPGEHTFAFQEEKKYTDLRPVTVTLDSGTITYIRVSTSLKVKNSVGYEPYERSFKLTQVDEALAVKEIADCCLDDGTQTTEETEPTGKKADDGFSVDKTQNPFSH